MLSTNEEVNFEKREGVPSANEKPNNAPKPLPEPPAERAALKNGSVLENKAK